MDNRPPTSSARRPPSSVRPITGRNIANGSVPGTASRLVSAAASQRPGSRATRPPSQISVVDRPTTQHGLYAPKTGTRAGTQRQIQDKPYFMALIRNRMSELYGEINRLQKENGVMQEEQRNAAILQKKAEALAAELKSHQSELADYNIVVDKMNVNEGVEDIEAEFAELKAQNDQEARAVESLFEQRQENEAKIRETEREILEARNTADNVVSQMSNEQRQKYAELKRQSDALNSSLEKLQEEQASIVSKRKQLEEEVALSQVKLEAVALHTKLREAQEKRDALLEEEATKGTPAEERERLLKQVKQDNAQLAGIEAKISELTKSLARAKDEIEQLETELDDQNSERSAKYRELKKRLLLTTGLHSFLGDGDIRLRQFAYNPKLFTGEETMDSFLDSFEQTKSAELERQEHLRESILKLKQDTDQKTFQADNLPSQRELHDLKNDLSFKEGELEKSKSTVTGLELEQRKLASDLQKMEQLDSKVRQELSTIRTRLDKMKEEIIIYEDIDKLKTQAQEKRESLLKEQASLLLRKDITKKVIDDQSKDLDALRRQLEQEDTFVKLTNLEKRWQHVEATNFQMREYIAAKVSEHSYRHLQQKIQSEVSTYNDLLQDSLVTTGPTML